MDTPSVYFTQDQVNDAISAINEERPSECMTTLQSEYPTLDIYETLQRQMYALGYEEDQIPAKPKFLDAVDTQAAPDLVCLMRKVGIQNLPTETAKRLCISMSPNGINDKEAVKSVYGDLNIFRNNSED